MPLMKKFGEDSRSFQDEGMVNFAEYSTDEQKTICIVVSYQFTNVIAEIIQGELSFPVKIKKSVSELRVKMGFTVFIDQFVNSTYALKVRDIMNILSFYNKEKRDEEQLMRFYRNELLVCMKKKGFTEMQICLVRIMYPKGSQVEKMKHFYVNTDFDVISHKVDDGKVEQAVVGKIKKKKEIKSVDNDRVSKRVKVEKPRETKEVKAINEKPKDPRRRPAEHAKCKLKTFSNIVKIKPVSRSVPRVPTESMRNFETEVNPSSFVVDEVKVSDDANEADNAISNIFDDILPPTGVFEEFSISDIVFPNDPPAPPPSAPEVNESGKNQTANQKFRTSGKGANFLKLMQQDRALRLSSSSDSSSDLSDCE
eukprot:gene14580-16083_t